MTCLREVIGSKDVWGGDLKPELQTKGEIGEEIKSGNKNQSLFCSLP